MSVYGKVETVTVNSKHPFHEEQGVHIVKVNSWVARESRVPGKEGMPMDIVEWDVVKTLAGDASAVGLTRTRMRYMNKMGSAEEVKQRAQAFMSAKMSASGLPGEFPMAQVNGQLLDGIVAQNGQQFAGLLVKIQVNKVKTKGGGDFTAITYAVPTAADLAGIEAA